MLQEIIQFVHSLLLTCPKIKAHGMCRHNTMLFHIDQRIKSHHRTALIVLTASGDKVSVPHHRLIRFIVPVLQRLFIHHIQMRPDSDILCSSIFVLPCACHVSFSAKTDSPHIIVIIMGLKAVFLPDGQHLLQHVDTALSIGRLTGSLRFSHTSDPAYTLQIPYHIRHLFPNPVLYFLSISQIHAHFPSSSALPASTLSIRSISSGENSRFFSAPRFSSI